MKITSHDDTTIQLSDGKTYEMFCFMTQDNGCLCMTRVDKLQDILVGDAINVSSCPKRLIVVVIEGEMISASDISGVGYMVRRSDVIETFRGGKSRWSSK